MSDYDILLARQPIFDKKTEIVAYELLYRTLEEHSAIADADRATSQVLVSAFHEMSIAAVLGGKKAYINFTPHLIVNPPPFDPGTLVVEVLENTTITDEIRAGIKRLKSDGFEIALDDFRRELSTDQLLDLADIVKLDVLEMKPDELTAHIDYLKPLGVSLLAEKIETYEMYEHCVELGFELFQGYFLSRPQLVKGSRVTESRLVLTRLLQAICQPEVSVAELSKLIASDPILSYKLLRLVNSSLYHTVQPIESLQHAISYLGISHTRNWVMVISLANLGDKPRALALETLIRARFCESLARSTKVADPERAFTVGLLSTLDAFYDAPLKHVLDELKLRADLVGALLSGTGPTGFLLTTVIHFERAEWDHVGWTRLQELGVNKKNAEAAYVDSLKWADDAFASFSDVQ